MNSNFGGVQSEGLNSVFTKLHINLGLSVIGVGCAGHIFHSTVRAVTEILFVDVEMVISKYICTSDLTQS
jgi:hypothetical protein